MCWSKTRPEHLQHLKSDPAFRAVGTERTVGAIRQLLEGQELPLPKDWGAFFLHFPTSGSWDVPSTGWHMDGDYTGELSPPCGLLIHAMLNDVGARHGITQNPPAAGARSAQLRKSLQRHPYLRDLCTAGDPAMRIARFHERAEVIDGHRSGQPTADQPYDRPSELRLRRSAFDDIVRHHRHLRINEYEHGVQ